MKNNKIGALGGGGVNPGINKPLQNQSKSMKQIIKSVLWEGGLLIPGLINPCSKSSQINEKQ